MYYKLFIKYDPEYGMFINKQKSLFTVEDPRHIIKYKNILLKLFNEKNLITDSNFITLEIPIRDINFKKN